MDADLHYMFSVFGVNSVDAPASLIFILQEIIKIQNQSIAIKISEMIEPRKNVVQTFLSVSFWRNISLLFDEREDATKEAL